MPVKTQIFYKAYATNIMGPTLTTESSFFTLADEPTTHVDGFAAAAGGLTSINLTWTTAANGADGYLILQKTGAAAPAGTPTDATGYSVGNTIGDGTVAAIVISGATLAQTISSLNPSTQYSYTIFPYAWDGANAGTYNYYTGVTVPSASATTNTPPVITFYDGFTGTDNIGGTGAAGTGNNGWITHSGTGTIPINAGSLTYAPLQASTGNRVTIPGDNATVSRDVNAALSLGTSTVAYYSLLLNVIDTTQIGSAFTDNGYFMNIGNTAGSSASTLFGRLHVKKVNSGSNYRLGIQNNSGTGASQTEFATDLVFGTTYLVVVKYDFNGASNDIATLWVDPSSLGGTEPSGGVSNSGGNATSATTFASICIRNASATPKADIDEVRAGITWADVTPPGVPATMQVSGVVADQVDTCYNATDSITVAGGVTTFIVQPGGSATMIAGQNINYMPGTMVMSGGYMHGYIDTTGTYCGVFAPTMVSGTMEVSKVVSEMEAGAFFKVYPNPTNDNFYIELDPTFRDTKTVVYIFGMVGDLIRQEEVMGNDRYEFSLGGKTPGIYFIRVFCGDKLGSQKIIKQ